MKHKAIGAIGLGGALGLVIYAGVRHNGVATFPSEPVAHTGPTLAAPPASFLDQFAKWVCQGCLDGPGRTDANHVCNKLDDGLMVCSMGEHIAVMRPAGSDCIDSNGQAKVMVGQLVTFVVATCWHSDRDGDCDTDLMDYAIMQRIVTED
jgi:hypothetical protein